MTVKPFSIIGEKSGQAEVRYLKMTSGAYQKVSWFKILERQANKQENK